MRTISLVLVVASMACYREAAAPPSAAVANKAPARAEPAASRDVLAYLPSDSELVIGADFKTVRTSALWADYEPQILAVIGPKLAEIGDRCGVDLLRSLESMTIGMRSLEGKDGVIVVRGIPRDPLIACEIESGADDPVVITEDRGIFTAVAKDGDRQVMTFADRSTLVVDLSARATADSMRALLRSRAPLRQSPAFLALFEQVPSDVALWFLINGNASVFRKIPASGPRLRGVYGEIRIGDHLAAASHVVLEDASQAMQSAAALNQALQQARPLFDKVGATSDGPVITIECELSSAKLQKLVAMATALYGNLGGKP